MAKGDATGKAPRVDAEAAAQKQAAQKQADSPPKAAAAGDWERTNGRDRATSAEAASSPVVADSAEVRPVPGSEVLGRGISIKPRQPYELKDFLLKRGKSKARIWRIPGGDQPYVVPQDCEVNDSPPLPAGRSTGQTIIEESWSRFSRELTLNVSAAASAKVFSVDATSFHGSNLQSAEDSYYALRNSFIPFWSVYLPSVDRKNVIDELEALEKGQRKPDQSDQLQIPDGPFDPLNRADYAKIFDRFGTHYVRSAWLGGKASLVFVVTKSGHLSKEEVKAGIEVTFAGVGKGAGSTARAETQARVRNNSSCTVFGSGGDPTELAKLTTLDPDQYNTWIGGVKGNPEIIEFGVAGIWTLIEDEVKGEALRQAYVQESTFTPLTAIVPVNEWLVFTKGDQVFDYAMTSKYGSSRLYVLACLFRAHMIMEPERLRDELARILEEPADSQPAAPDVQAAEIAMPAAEATAERAAGALQDKNIPVAELQERLARFLNVLILSGHSIREQGPLKELFAKMSNDRFSSRTQQLLKRTGTRVVMLNRLLLEDAFPDYLMKRGSRLSLRDYLPPLDAYPRFQRPQAALSLYGFGPALDSKIYLFRWRECLRLHVTETDAVVDPGYPKALGEDWPGVDFPRIDAAVAIAPDKVYFFRGAEYIRVDLRNGHWEMGTRDLIKDRWPGVIFDRIDTVANWGSNKLYFFSEDQYIRYDFASRRADPGYPKVLSSNYVEDWELFD